MGWSRGGVDELVLIDKISSRRSVGKRRSEETAARHAWGAPPGGVGRTVPSTEHQYGALTPDTRLSAIPWTQN